MGHTLHHQGLNLDEELLRGTSRSPDDAPRPPSAARERGAGLSARFAIVVGRFYEDLAERLVAGARAAFARGGRRRRRGVRRARARSSCRWPPATRPAAGASPGVACLGAVIRGETDHYDYVCAEAARGIMEVQLRTGVPCAFGVLTCETMEQALARSGGGKRDQGRHAAEAVLRMAALRARAGGG